MKTLLFVLALLVAIGTGTAVYLNAPSSGEKAEARYHFLEHNGASQDELCQAASATAAAYAEDHDSANFRTWHELAHQSCLNAELSHRLGS